MGTQTANFTPSSSVSDLVGVETVAGTKQEVLIALADLKTLLGIVDTYAADFVFVDAPNNNVSLGPNVRPNNYVDLAQPLIKGQGNTLVGREMFIGPNTLVNFCSFFGSGPGRDAKDLYCCDAFGIRNQRVLVDGQYVSTYGCDAAYSLTYGRNSTLLAAKAGLYKTDVRGSVIIGVGSAYCAGTADNTIIIGANAADGNQTADVYNWIGLFAIGTYAARRVSGPNNRFTGHNAASQTTVTGNQNQGDGRGVFGSLTSGALNYAAGDGAGGTVSTANSTTSVGRGADTGNFSNSAALGALSTCTAPNQVQLGDSATTPYAFAALVIRSDKRDKTDGKEIDLQIATAIVLGANWLTYRSNPRELYVEHIDEEIEVDDFEGVLQPDGSYERMPIRRMDLRRTRVQYKENGKRAGTRRHAGVFAQDEHARLKAIGIDFAGIKYAAHDGKGEDVWSLQYEQYIPYMGALLKHLSAANDDIRQIQDSLDERMRVANDNFAALAQRVTGHDEEIASLKARIAELEQAA